ncbi:hypothetical protein CSA37_05105 [Candidatus Fermentibacteria bacterium]|nr:MAG: hypothetical protein CSA37_05105 [Candidatus Fermentibacteria bacterium]
MKKELFVNPAAAVTILMLFFILSCGAGDRNLPQADQGSRRILSEGQWQVSYLPSEDMGIAVSLYLSNLPSPENVDSLNFEDSGIPDSLRFNRFWELGSGSVLVMSASVPFAGGRVSDQEVWELLSSAELIPPAGLRTVRLSDRSVSEVDSVRALVSVEPPPGVSHEMQIAFNPENPDSCLILTDSVVVRFTGSNTDSLQMDFTDQYTSVISVAGRFVREGAENNFVCYADSQGIYSGVFICVMGMNRLYLCSDGQVAGQARLTSAFLTGRGMYPVSRTPEDYTVSFSVPEGYRVWTPLEEMSDSIWQSGPGGIIGGLPVAVGNYRETTLLDRYSLMSFEGGAVDSLDSLAIERLVETLNDKLYFPTVDYSFVEVVSPDGDIVIPGFASLMFTRSSLDDLADVSSWPETLSSGGIPDGWQIITGAAEGFLVQSLELDPVLLQMLREWMPLCFYEKFCTDPETVPAIREVWLKHYLFNTQYFSMTFDSLDTVEYSLADPALVESPLRPFAAGGKGVIILEYLDSQRRLNRLPHLLHDFTHASSANYWAKICTSLRISRGTEIHELLKRLLYLPGIPQIQASWYEENGSVFITASEIQPGPEFGIPLETCALHFQDTVVVRELNFLPEEGMMSCETDLLGFGPVLAIDLNLQRLIPADFIYIGTAAE